MIRYPGSKDKIARILMGYVPCDVRDELFQHRRERPIEYREPFFGGGAIGFRLLKCLPANSHVWLNDKDFGVRCLWKAVHETPDELIELVRSFRPSVDAFYQFKAEDGRTDMDPVETGFRKFALHQISFSGLGAKAGGPIGGRKQSSQFNVKCRWNATRHCLEIMRRSALLRQFAKVQITSHDFAPMIETAPSHSFVYADPPYCAAGPALYKHSFSEDDHRRLASALRKCRTAWVLSYDDHPLVRELYPWADFHSVSLTYTGAIAKIDRRKNLEVVITPKPSDTQASRERAAS